MHQKMNYKSLYLDSRVNRLDKLDRTRFKQIVVSNENYDQLKTRGHLRMTFNDVITELLKDKRNAIGSEVLQGQQVRALNHAAPGSKGGVNSNG